jgi:hypothetical protein
MRDEDAFDEAADEAGPQLIRFRRHRSAGDQTCNICGYSIDVNALAVTLQGCTA